ncbi:hypothetical protein PCANC_27267 [Puccinia coronata f. sp. avenae]|uniref:Uncharacterized protein n=1 Tax=Puccinia coronata f. sp. avenae TaxID=200324 RepID=A0A2N5TJE0_9BASI|nr:hypothetical protein PCANC_27267 [Puccinia coronata f. sp. avenae]
MALVDTKPGLLNAILVFVNAILAIVNAILVRAPNAIPFPAITIIQLDGVPDEDKPSISAPAVA